MREDRVMLCFYSILRLITPTYLVVQTEEKSHQEGFIRHSAEKQTLRLPILDGIRNYATKEHMLLVGQPGAGKSTALARFLLWAAEQARQNSQAPIPVLIELRQYKPPVTNESGVLYLLQDFLEGYGLPLELSDIKKLLFVEKRFLLLIDGLNELSIDKARTDVKRFREKCSNLKIPMVITTRDLGMGGELGIERRMEIQPLPKKEVQRFLQDCIPDQSQQTLQQLSERMRELGQTPLMMWMLYVVFQKTGEIPASRGEAFRKFTQLYERRHKEDAPIDDESRRWWSSLLKPLAFEMMQSEKSRDFQLTISQQEAETVLTSFLKSQEVNNPADLAIRCLNDLLKYHLIQLNPKNQEIKFCHQLLQEYYTAEYLLLQLPNLSDEQLKQHYLNYLKWTEALH